MMKNYVFYTFEGFTESPTIKTLENIQILGFAQGKSKLDAKNRLLKENQWIIENDFHQEEIESQQLFDNKTKKLVQQLIEYNWESEEKHYEEAPNENHIFLILKKLKSLID